MRNSNITSIFDVEPGDIMAIVKLKEEACNLPGGIKRESSHTAMVVSVNPDPMDFPTGTGVPAMYQNTRIWEVLVVDGGNSQHTNDSRTYTSGNTTRTWQGVGAGFMYIVCDLDGNVVAHSWNRANTPNKYSSWANRLRPQTLVTGVSDCRELAFGRLDLTLVP